MSRIKVTDFYYGAVLSMLFSHNIKPALIENGSDRQVYDFTTNNAKFTLFVAYVILAVSLTGHKEVLSIHIGENESAKYWLGVLNELKNRGVKDILVICADGLTGMKEAANAAFPQTELQRWV